MLAYKIPLIKRSGKVENIIAYCMDNITLELPHIDMVVILSLFWGVPKQQDVLRPSGYGNPFSPSSQGRHIPHDCASVC